MINDQQLTDMMHRNYIPSTVRSIHLIAVCGTGMGALAGMLKDAGYDVTGSDSGVYPPMSLFLADKGIKVTDRFDPANLIAKPDLVIVGNAVTRSNPEAEALAASSLPFCSMPQALNHFAARNKQVILVTGTHGKTTSASLLAWILFSAELDPSFFVGGILQNFTSNYRLGQGKFIIIEGDEYDTAFFDKGPKFLHFQPRATVLTGIEFDHADIYRDLNHVKQAFRQMISGLPPGSLIAALDDNQHINDLISGTSARIIRYGTQESSCWRLDSFQANSSGTRFRIMKNQVVYGEFNTSLIGEHNLMNILSTVAVCDDIGIPQNKLAKALESFQGTKRRQEIRGIKRGITVIDDFAHHPTAVRETIKALKQWQPNNRLIAVFEPRTNSSMRKIFQEEYAASFDAADIICIRTPSRLDKIPTDQRFSAQQLVHDLQQQGKEAYHFEHTDAIIEFIVQFSVSGDLLLIMSNGGFDNIHQRLLERL